MPVKSIIDIEVNDAAFAKFTALYKEYQDLLKKSPDTWQRVNKEIDNASGKVEDVAEAIDDVGEASKGVIEKTKGIGASFHQNVIFLQQNNDISNKIEASQGRIRKETEQQARTWSAMAKDSKAFAGNVLGATKSLLRWAEITGVISGILGSGGLFGIDRLAQSAAGQRKDASGIRVTPGELRSFDLNFNRLLGNPEGFLTGVSESLSDVTKAAPYGALGLNYGQERNKRPADVAIDVLRAEKALADRTPQSQLGNVFASRQLGMLGQSVEDFQRIKDRPLAELLEYIQHNQSDRRTLDLSQPQLKAWEDFKVQLGRAGDQIERTFIVALTPLAPQLGHLSKSVSGLVDAFLRNPETAKWLDEAAAGIKEFGGYIGTPQFKTEVKGFVADVGELGDAALSVAKKLKWIVGEGDSKTVSGAAIGAAGGYVAGGPVGAVAGGLGGWIGAKLSEWSDEFDKAHPWAAWVDQLFGRKQPGVPDVVSPKFPTAPNGVPHTGPVFGPQMSPSAFRPMTGAGIPSDITPALLASVEYQESRGRDVTNPRSGAAGYFQFMPGTARQYGVNPHDERSSLAGATRYLTDLKNQFGGDTDKALAAYNWGPGNLKRDIAQYGDKWRDHLPNETRKYVDEVEGRLPRTPPKPAPQYAHQFKDRSVQVRIHNNTGGNANVTLSQLSV